MIRNLILFVLILVVNFTSANAQKKVFILTESKTDTIHQRFQSILILGAGSTVTRVFLDRLSEELIKKLNSEKINSEYYYLGKDIDTLSETFISITKKDYDAILIFNPDDTARFKSTSKERRNVITLPSTGVEYTLIGKTTSIKTSYHQSFNLNLYSYEDKSKSLWEANLIVDFNMGRLSNYQKISNKIYWRLKANNYIK